MLGGSTAKRNEMTRAPTLFKVAEARSLSYIPRMKILPPHLISLALLTFCAGAARADGPGCAVGLDTPGVAQPTLRAEAIAKFKREARAMDPSRRAKMCDQVTSLLTSTHLAWDHGPATLELLTLFCADQKAPLRAAVRSALAVVDVLPRDAYAGVIDDADARGADPRLKQVRAFLRRVLKLEVMSTQDWRVVLNGPAARLLPLVDALAPRRAWFGRGSASPAWLAGLGLSESERTEIAGRLLTEQISLTAIARWTQLADPLAWEKLEHRMTPLQWLESQRLSGADLAPRLAEFERRVDQVGTMLAPRCDVRRPIRDLIVDQTLAPSVTSRVVASLRERWGGWYGQRPLLPDLDDLRRAKVSRAHLETFYGPDAVDPRARRREGRAVAKQFRNDQFELRWRARNAFELRAALERPFDRVPAHPGHQRHVYLTIRDALRRALPRTGTAREWIHLAETTLPPGFDQSQIQFLIPRVPDLIRAGDQRLAWLDDVRFDRPYTAGLSADDPRSTLFHVRAMRDSVDPAARWEATLNRRAVEVLLAVDPAAVPRASALGPLFGDHGVAMRAALARDARRPMLEYLHGRSLAGARPLVLRAQWAKFSEVARDAGYTVEVAHVDSQLGRFVALTRPD